MLDAPSVLSLIEAALRGMLLALLLLLAFAMLRLLRQNVRRPLAQATVAMLFGLCEQVAGSTPAFEAMVPALWQAPLVAVSVGNAVLFWAFAQALFDDGFMCRPVHAVAWLAVAALAGGHTALTLAGGRWSPEGFKRHCEANLVDYFQFCVGLITRLTGSLLDGVRKAVALAVIRHRFDDRTMREHTDPRIVAVVAGVPAAADFDMASLAIQRVPLGLVMARQDRWLVPRFHSDKVLQACKSCEVVDDLPNAGHGSLLSPLPPGLTGLVGEMLNDPPGFNRSAATEEVNGKITAFFGRHVLR